MSACLADSRTLSAGIALLAMLASACGGPATAPSEQAESPSATPIAAGGSIVIVSIDTLRSDRLPAYGYQAGHTPAIDRLRREGILFERVYSPVPLTTPSHASMLTGLLPPRHGVRDNAGYRLSNQPLHLAAALSAHGFATGAAVSSFTMRATTGLGRGFDHYDDRIEQTARATLAEVQRGGEATLDALLPWLHEAAGARQPFLAFLHLYEPHTPYTPPPAFASFPHPYDGEIAAADAVLGRLLDALTTLGLYDATTIVVVSDHGEGLGEHGEAEHGILLHREALQVPLIIKLPNGAKANTSVAAPVGIVDLTPTLLALAGVAPPDDLDGRSLLPLLDTADHETPGLYGESFHPELRYGWSGLTSWIDDRWHLIDGPKPELYDLSTDPAERANVLTQNRRVYARMKQALAAVARPPAPPSAIDEETRRHLESLGYLGSARPSNSDLPDPKSQLPTLEPLRRGIDALAAGDQEGAIKLIRQALALNDRFEAGWTYLGLAYEESAQMELAFDAYRRAFDLSGGTEAVIDALARVALRLGRFEDAAHFLPLAIANRPEEIELRFLYTRTLLAQQRLDEAMIAAEQTLAQAPDHPDARYQHAAAAMGLRRLEEAESGFLGAIEAAGGNHPPALHDLAVLYLSQGRRGEARRLLVRLVRIQPENREATALLERIGS